jgi:hypothetical protein
MNDQNPAPITDAEGNEQTAEEFFNEHFIFYHVTF